VVNHQPAFRGLNGNGSGSNLGTLPAILHTHHKAVFTPVHQVCGLAEENIPERGMTVITWTAEQDIFVIDFAREKHPVAVERQQGVFQKMKSFKIKGISNANRWTVISVAPGYVISVLKPDNPRVIPVLELTDFRIVRLPGNGIVINIPVEPITAETTVQVHLPPLIVTAKNTCKTILEGNDCRIKNAVGGWDPIARDDWIGSVTPDNILASGRTLLPWKVGKGWIGHGMHS